MTDENTTADLAPGGWDAVDARARELEQQGATPAAARTQAFEEAADADEQAWADSAR